MSEKTVLDNELLAVRAAELYYQENKTQDEIGAILHITRWKVGRLITQAREQGIIRIEISHPRARRLGMEQDVKAAFSLEAAIVVPGGGDAADVASRVASGAADYLVAMRPYSHVLGVSWGKTLHQVAQSLPAGWSPPLRVVQVNGGVSHSAAPGLASETATMIATKAHGEVTLLPTPAILERRETKEAIESDRSIRGVLEQAATADTHLFSAGPASEVSIHVQSGYLKSSDIQHLQRSGAVGDVLGRYITPEGTIADRGLDERTLGISLETLREAPRRIAVVAGREKHPVALAIARSGLATVMIMDEGTATFLLGKHTQEVTA